MLSELFQVSGSVTTCRLLRLLSKLSCYGLASVGGDITQPCGLEGWNIMMKSKTEYFDECTASCNEKFFCGGIHSLPIKSDRIIDDMKYSLLPLWYIFLNQPSNVTGTPNTINAPLPLWIEFKLRFTIDCWWDLSSPLWLIYFSRDCSHASSTVLPCCGELLKRSSSHSDLGRSSHSKRHFQRGKLRTNDII